MAYHLIPSNATIKALKPGDPRRRLSDGAGMYLLLFVNGGSHARGRNAADATASTPSRSSCLSLDRFQSNRMRESCTCSVLSGSNLA